MPYHELVCKEVWGGNGNTFTDLVIPGLKGVLYSRSCEGRKGGDVYYATACSGGLVSRFCLADVTGHGEQVVRISEWLHDILRDIKDFREPERVFVAMNERVHQFGLEAMTTVASITFDSVAGEITVCYAGHPPALVYQPDRGTWETLDVKRSSRHAQGSAENLPLGVADRTTYTHQSMPLEEGSRIFLYSDGLTETPSANGDLWGTDRLVPVLAEGLSKPVPDAARDVMDALTRHAGTKDFTHDDITFTLLEVLPRSSSPMLVRVMRNKFRTFRRQMAGR